MGGASTPISKCGLKTPADPLEQAKARATTTAKTNTEVRSPSATLRVRMTRVGVGGVLEEQATATTKARVVVERFGRCAGACGGAGPSTSLRCAQDDKSVMGFEAIGGWGGSEGLGVIS